MHACMYLSIQLEGENAAMPAACSAADQGDSSLVPIAMQFTSSC